MSELIDPEVFRRFATGTPEDLRNMQHPDLKNIRDHVLKTVTTEIGITLRELGYKRQGLTWRKESEFGRSILQLQRGRYGLNLFINAGAVVVKTASPLGRLKALFARSMGFEPAPAARISPDDPVTWDPMKLSRFQDFCPELSPMHYETDSFSYVRLHECPVLMEGMLTVIRRRIIPWLETCHQPRSSAELPSPKEVKREPAFRMNRA